MPTLQKDKPLKTLCLTSSSYFLRESDRALIISNILSLWDSDIIFRLITRCLQLMMSCNCFTIDSGLSWLLGVSIFCQYSEWRLKNDPGQLTCLASLFSVFQQRVTAYKLLQVGLSPLIFGDPSLLKQCLTYRALITTSRPGNAKGTRQRRNICVPNLTN